MTVGAFPDAFLGPNGAWCENQCTVLNSVLCSFFADMFSSYVRAFFLSNELGEQTLLPLVGRRLNITQAESIGSSQTFSLVSHYRSVHPLTHYTGSMAGTIVNILLECRHPSTVSEGAACDTYDSMF